MDESSSTYKPANHAEKVLSRVAGLHNTDGLCDVLLIADNERIPAHRLILSACSDYFAAMFRSNVREAQEREVHIQGIEGAALSSLIKYFYTGELQLQPENIEEILTAACIIQLSEVIEACSKYLMDHLHPSNSLGILQYADRQNCSDLYKVAHNYVMENFVDIINENSTEFLQLTKDEMIRLLASDDVNVPSEEALFTAVIDWVNHDSQSREPHLAALLELLKLPLMSPEFLADKVDTNPLIRSSPDCQRLVMEAMKYHLLHERRHAMQSYRTKPRKSTVGVLLAVGGSEAETDRLASIEKYELRTDCWQKIFSLNSRRMQFGVAVLNGKLYVVGGRDGLKTLNTVECWDMKGNSWSQVASMANHRHGLCVTTLEGPIYAIGGHDGWSYLNCVERWDMQSRKWSYVSPMNSQRSTAGVAVLGPRIYVCGGRDGSSCLRTLEAFDPHTNKWTMLAPMNKRRGGLGLAACNGYLFAVGGHDSPAQNKHSSTSNGRFNCCERYDPITDQWCMIASLSGPRDAVGLCLLGDKLFCVGGYDGQRHLQDVESYDPQQDTWTKVTSLCVGRVGACVVHIPYNGSPLTQSISTLSLASSPRQERPSSMSHMSVSYSEPRLLFPEFDRN